jgi:nucleoid DNA-binding protein
MHERSYFVPLWRSSVTKADLIDLVAEEVDLSKRQVGDIVDLILDSIRDSLVKGDKVQLIPFGSFVVRDRTPVRN